MHLPSVSNSSIPSQPPSPSFIPKLFAPDRSTRSHAQTLSAQSSPIICVRSRSLADPPYHQPNPRCDREHECTCGVNLLGMSAQHQHQLCPRSHWIHHLAVAALATFWTNNAWFSDYPLPEWSHLKTWYRYALSPPSPTIFDIDLAVKVQASWGGLQSSNT